MNAPLAPSPRSDLNGNIGSLTQAVQRYFELLYDCDVCRFETVFRMSANLHGYRDGAMTVWSAAEYRDILSKRTAPKSLNAPREEEILLIDFASADQALVKVRVRVNTIVFIDHLIWHRFGDQWLITAKAYHIERVYPG